jgi:hypothetical protein
MAHVADASSDNSMPAGRDIPVMAQCRSGSGSRAGQPDHAPVGNKGATSEEAWRNVVDMFRSLAIDDGYEPMLKQSRC